MNIYKDSDMEKLQHLLGCHAISINSLLGSFLIALRLSNLKYQAKSAIRIMVSGSSSSKLLSILIFLKSILRIPSSSQENVSLPESSSK